MTGRRSMGSLAVLALLAGCAQDEPTSAVTETVTATETIPPPTVTVTVTPTPEPAAGDAALGTGQPGNGGGPVTVFAYQADVAQDAPEPESGGRWDAADVQVCNGEGEAFVNQLPWSLIGASNEFFDASGTGYSQFPTPGYPFGDTNIGVGECIRGWIVFDVTSDALITGVRYSPQSLPSPLRWAT